MKQYDEAIEQYQTLNPGPKPFTYLIRLDMRLYQAPLSDEREQVIDVWLGRSGKVSDPQRLRLTLHGAICAKSLSLRPSMNVYIDILSIRERQWSDLHYVLIDLEGTSELFYCRVFEVKIEDLYLDSLL